MVFKINIINSKIKLKQLFLLILILIAIIKLIEYYGTQFESENKIDTSVLNNKIHELSNLIISNKSNDTLNEFKLNHLKIISGDSPLKVVFNGYTEAGYANKIYSMISSLLIAILTDSALIIRWKDIDRYIEEPLYLSFNKFNSNSQLNPDFDKGNIYYAKASENAWKNKKDIDSLIKTFIPYNVNRILYNHYDAYFFEICSNPIYFKKLSYYGLIKKETIDRANYIIKNLNKFSNEQKSEYILRVGYEVGGNLLKFWIPKNYLLKMINFYLNNLFKGYYMIGIQFRMEFLYDDIDSSDIPTFIKCALEIEKDVLKKNLNFNEIYKGFRWFVSSDSQHLLDKLKSTEYFRKIIILDDIVGPIGHIEKNSNAYPRAILDNELLSHCDQIIMTGGSTFGFIAAMKTKKMPYYINGKINMPKCRITRLSELSKRPPGNFFSWLISFFVKSGDNAAVF